MHPAKRYARLGSQTIPTRTAEESDPLVWLNSLQRATQSTNRRMGLKISKSGQNPGCCSVACKNLGPLLFCTAMTDSGFQQKRGRFTKLASTTAAVCGISFSESAQNVQKLRQTAGVGRLHFVHANVWVAMRFFESRTVGGGKIGDVSKLGCPGTWRRRERKGFLP